MRYSIFVNRFMRPESFRSLVVALEFASGLSGDVHVLDWWTWKRIEVERCPGAKRPRLAVGT